MDEGEKWLKAHPEFDDGSYRAKRLPTGETNQAERIDPEKHLEYGGDGGAWVTSAADPTEGPTGWAPNRPLWQSLDIDERAQRVRVERVLDALSQGRSDLLRRVFWEQQTQADIAEELGVTQQAVSQRIDTALGAFQRKLAELTLAGELDDIDPREL